MSKLILNEVVVPADIHFFMLEDTVQYQQKMVDTLLAIGFTGKVSIFPTIQQAKAALESENPDFFLLDWNLPDGEGVELLDHIKSSERHKNKPALMVTTLDDVGNILTAVGKGANGYIVKPFNTEEVVEKLAFALEKYA